MFVHTKRKYSTLHCTCAPNTNELTAQYIPEFAYWFYFFHCFHTTVSLPSHGHPLSSAVNKSARVLQHAAELTEHNRERGLGISDVFAKEAVLRRVGHVQLHVVGAAPHGLQQFEGEWWENEESRKSGGEKKKRKWKSRGVHSSKKRKEHKCFNYLYKNPPFAPCPVAWRSGQGQHWRWTWSQFHTHRRQSCWAACGSATPWLRTTCRASLAVDGDNDDDDVRMRIWWSGFWEQENNKIHTRTHTHRKGFRVWVEIFTFTWHLHSPSLPFPRLPCKPWPSPSSASRTRAT